MTWLLIAAALAVGYTLGRARLGHRASDWAAETHESAAEWALYRYRWPSLAVMAVEIAWLVAAHPVQSWRNWQSWTRAEEPVAAPVYDPEWAAKWHANREDPS